MLMEEAILITIIFAISAFTCYVGYAYGYEKGHDDVVNKLRRMRNSNSYNYDPPIVQEHYHGEY